MSHSCNDESHDHDHDHGGNHSHDGTYDKTDPSRREAHADRNPDDLTPAVQSSLYRYIDFDKITTYNEAAPGSGRAIIKKAWDQRLDTVTTLESDADEQLLIYVPSVDSLDRPVLSQP